MNFNAADAKTYLGEQAAGGGRDPKASVSAGPGHLRSMPNRSDALATSFSTNLFPPWKRLLEPISCGGTQP
jgi:hypothetical protein